MPRTFRLQIVTPDRVILDGPVLSVTAPGVEGQFTVLAGHAPLVAELEIGEMRYRDEEGDEHPLALHGGFLQVARDRTTVLADAAERPEDIDLDRAQRAMNRVRIAGRGR